MAFKADDNVENDDDNGIKFLMVMMIAQMCAHHTRTGVLIAASRRTHQVFKFASGRVTGSEAATMAGAVGLAARVPAVARVAVEVVMEAGEGAVKVEVMEAAVEETAAAAVAATVGG